MYGKPVKTLLFSLVVTLMALMITWSAVKLIVKRDAIKDSNEAGMSLDADYFRYF